MHFTTHKLAPGKWSASFKGRHVANGRTESEALRMARQYISDASRDPSHGHGDIQCTVCGKHYHSDSHRTAVCPRCRKKTQHTRDTEAVTREALAPYKKEIALLLKREGIEKAAIAKLVKHNAGLIAHCYDRGEPPSKCLERIVAVLKTNAGHAERYDAAHGKRDPSRSKRGMTLSEIKRAVEAGKTVHWQNDGYVVTKDHLGQWFIVFKSNNHHIGLTWQDGKTMNGKPSEFYIGKAGRDPTSFKSHTETHGGAHFETGTVTHNGREFSAGGSVVDPAHGHITGYVKREANGSYHLTTWEGKPIGTLYPTGSWKQRTPRSHWATQMFSFKMHYEGATYRGRGQGEGMLLHMKRAK